MTTNHDQEEPQPGLWDLGQNKPPAEPMPPRTPSRSVASTQPSPGSGVPATAKDSEVWDIDILATFLKVPKQTVYAWRKRGYGPPGFRVGKHLRWRASAVRTWVLELEAD